MIISRITLILLFYIISLDLLFSQPKTMPPRLLDDKVAQDIFKQALDKMYNFEFEESSQLIKQIQKRYAKHPALHAYFSLYSYWSKVLGHEHNDATFKAHRQHMYDAVECCEAMLAQEPENTEATFFMMMTYGMIARQDSDAGDYMKALNHTRKAYLYLKRGFPLKEKYDEFYFSTGLYNYYRVQYPEMNPIYRPFMSFFVSGDKKLGLKDMEISVDKSVFMRTEALTFLSHIYVHYENKPAYAWQFAKPLYREHPQNLIFALLYVEVALANNEYAIVEPIIAKLEKGNGKVYTAAAQTFRGIISEKRDKDDAEAQIWYNKAIESSSKLRRQTDYYRALTYAGLARIAQRNGHKSQAIALYQKANSQIYYLQIKQEAAILSKQK